MKKKLLSLCILLIMLMMPMVANAAIGTLYTDAKSLNVGATLDIDLKAQSSNSLKIASAEGIVTSNDPTCVQVVSVTSDTEGTTDGSFTVLDMRGTGLTTVATVKVKGLKACSTTLKISNVNLGNSLYEEEYGLSFTSATITVKEVTPKSSDNTLSNLTVSSGTLSPTFSPTVTSYTVTVPNEVSSITITGTKNHNKASVSGGGTKNLSVGLNTFTITCTAENGSANPYTVKVTREAAEVLPVEEPKSNDATLKSLTTSKGTLSPAFDANTLSYSMEVDDDVESIDVTATPNSDKATVTVEGNTGLKEGMNNITVKVTAEDGTVKTYVINVTKKAKVVPDKPTTTTKAPKSSNNYLSGILVSNGELSPKFEKKTQSYEVNVPNDTEKLELKVYTEDSKARYEIVDNKDFKVGTNNVTIRVVAEDGSVRIYTIKVNKLELKANTDLENLLVNGATYTPKFSKGTVFYESTVKGKVKQISVTGIPENKNAKVEYYLEGELLNNGNVNLEEGYNLITVKVIDENGFAKSYSLNVFRKAYTYTIFGVKIPKWLFWLLFLLLLLLLLLLILFLLKRRRKEEKETIIKEKEIQGAMPKIEFKPEFNFGSKNQDNDTAGNGSVLNQGTGDTSSNTQDNDNNGNSVKENKAIDDENVYDPYDEVVTVDELIDAIDQQDPKKLRILYEQEMLNRKKAEMKAEEKKGKHAKKDDK